MNWDADHRVTLRDYVERIFDEKQKALELAFKAQQEALALASRTLELRLEKLNELRQEVTQDRSNYITRIQYEAEVGALEKKINQAEGALTVARFLGAGGIFALLIELARAAGYLK
ncbi:MAG TPA: hypothetical protein VGR43_00215 [Dehalococcoidia bacterium]|jgi:HAMP domain-containing protein|nr:hypothetical protein [Dehalococcoidia bacterium]